MASSNDQLTWNSLNDKEREIFQEVCNTLVDETFICQLKYDTRKGRTYKNDEYYYAKKFLPLLKNYFGRVGWEVKHDDLYRAVMLRRPNSKGSRLSSYTTLFLFGCRLIFDDELQMTGNSEAVDCSESKVIEKLATLGALVNTKTTASDRREALRYLEFHNLIQRKKPGAWSAKESNEFVILPTIAMLLDPLTIQDVLNQVSALINNYDSSTEGEEDESENE